ncbi:MAG: hypothetical protein MHM6MM_003587 [Cercozoa sp. M6MM]
MSRNEHAAEAKLDLNEEFDAIIELLGDDALIARHSDSLKVRVSATPSRSLQLGISTIPHLRFDVTSHVFCTALVERLQAECVNKTPFAAAQLLHSFVCKNPLSAAWEELQQLRHDLTEMSTEDGPEADRFSAQIKVNERRGSVKLKLHRGRYFANCTLQVPSDYPLDPVVVTIGRSNFPSHVLQVMQRHATHVANKLAEGYMPSESTSSSANYASMSQSALRQQVQQQRLELSKERFLQMKEDVQFLRQVAEKRDEVESKRDRRHLRRFLGRAAAADAEEAQRIRRAAEERFRRQRERPPLPSLLHTALYVARDWVHHVPVQLCVYCNKRVWPRDPQKLTSLLSLGLSKKTKKTLPQRTQCGCWYHHQCLDKTIMEPPFGRECRRCPGRQVLVRASFFF